ncbi:MAG: hypothetical protein M1812_003860 [Candelaria pacifica]|nr:MAG: hypothetical protein M1812_003860 [Candelaria pacifica]
MRKNISSGGWVVQKFGGTSVGKSALSIAEIVQSSLDDNRVAIVCSARSSQSKAEGTTNRLLRAAQEASKPAPRNYQIIVEAIQNDHVEAANDYIRSPRIREELTFNIRKEVQELLEDLGSTLSKSEDAIISKGEKLSARFVAALLQDRGVDSVYVDLSQVISFDVPGGLSQSFYDRLAEALAQKLVQYGDRVPVLTGYFGSVPGGLLHGIGRGYTDLCAALFAVGVNAKELQVWKEVDGIFTADPRTVPTARLLTSITPGEAAELTFYGSEVIHPFTMEQVIRAKIPIRIKNVLSPHAGGTVIFPDPPSVAGQVISNGSTKTFRTRSLSALSQRQRPKRPTAVTIKHNIIVINVHSNKRSLAHGFFKNIFSILDTWRLTIDLISTSEVHVSMALHSESALLSGGGEDEVKILDRDLDGAISALHEYGEVDIMPNMAILSLVGKQMKNMMGIAGKMFSTLGENNVNIEMISQGRPDPALSHRLRTAPPGHVVAPAANTSNLTASKLFTRANLRPTFIVAECSQANHKKRAAAQHLGAGNRSTDDTQTGEPWNNNIRLTGSNSNARRSMTLAMADITLSAQGYAPVPELYTGAWANVNQGLHGNYRDILTTYWQQTINHLETDTHDYKLHQLPLARIKKVMKADPEVKMISAEAPILFAKGCDIFITELTMRAWIHAEENKRRTLQRSDIASALAKSDMFDFLIDIVPREEAAAHAKRTTGQPGSAGGAAPIPPGSNAAPGQVPPQQSTMPQPSQQGHPQHQHQMPPPDYSSLGQHPLPQEQDYRTQPGIYAAPVQPAPPGAYGQPPQPGMYGEMEGMYGYPPMGPQQEGRFTKSVTVGTILPVIKIQAIIILAMRAAKEKTTRKAKETMMWASEPLLKSYDGDTLQPLVEKYTAWPA